METIQVKAVVEGLLFICGDEGTTIKQIAYVTDSSENKIKCIIDELIQDYANDERGMRIMQSNEVYHLTTKPEHSSYYKKMLQSPRTTRMSQAALETLAIIAYEQPVTRVEIEDIRGVNSDYAVQTLLARSLIEEVGRKDSVGRPALFGTSTDFLTYFGLSSLDELPELPEGISSDDVEREADLYFDQFRSQDT